jgi:Glycosyl transferase family 2
MTIENVGAIEGSHHNQPVRGRMPGVSVVMAVYNGERFLREAVDSVLGQTFEDLELIVIDDGSTDGSSEILSSYAAADARVLVHRQANAGTAAALNRGLHLARAPFVARLDADDLALPDRFERQHRFLAQHERVAVVGGAVTFIDEEGRAFAEWQYPLSDAEIRRTLDDSTPLAHPAVMMRAAAVIGVGGYRPVLPKAQDVDLWLRLAAGHELANVPEPVLRYRMHLRQASVRELELQTLCSLAARAAARARSEGRPDPLDAVERIDHETLHALGVTREEITAAFVGNATWLGRTMSSAGYADAADELLAQATARARSASGSRAAVASAYRARAEVLRARRRRLRAAVMTARARGASLTARFAQRSRRRPV